MSAKKLTRRVLNSRLKRMRADDPNYTWLQMEEWYAELDAHVRAQDEKLKEIADQAGAGLIVYRDSAAARFLRPIREIARAARMEE